MATRPASPLLTVRGAQVVGNKWEKYLQLLQSDYDFVCVRAAPRAAAARGAPSRVRALTMVMNRQ